jgi:hypothetical protein
MSHLKLVRHALLLFLIAGCNDAAPHSMNAVASAGMGAPPTAAGGGTADSAGTGGAHAAAAGSAEPSMPMTSAPAPTIDDGMPTFTNIYTFDFRSCRATCHVMGTAGLLMATQESAWNSLVNQPSNPARECAQLGKQRVVPNDPDNSLLYLKLDMNAPCGQQMPPGGQLSRVARERVRTWIAMGAKND